MKPLTKKQVEKVFTDIFMRMREKDFEDVLTRLVRQTNFKCLVPLRRAHGKKY